jgi:phage tail-like protein
VTTTDNGWLLGQLPQAMARDRVVGAFVHGCQEVADGLRQRVESVEHELDVDLASPEMLTFVASWLGVPAESLVSADEPVRDAQRRLIRAVGQVLGWRGTRRGVEILLEALTGGRVDVSDSGGIFGRDDPLPPADDVVRVSMAHTGGLSEQQILAFLAEELPVGTRVELAVRAAKGRARVG